MVDVTGKLCVSIFGLSFCSTTLEFRLTQEMHQELIYFLFFNKSKQTTTKRGKDDNSKCHPHIGSHFWPSAFVWLVDKTKGNYSNDAKQKRARWRRWLPAVCCLSDIWTGKDKSYGPFRDNSSMTNKPQASEWGEQFTTKTAGSLTPLCMKSCSTKMCSAKTAWRETSTSAATFHELPTAGCTLGAVAP